jgi:hypothetical protein
MEPVVIELGANNQKDPLEIKLEGLEEITGNSSNLDFGGGLELLMNEKKKGTTGEMGLSELSDLEADLNDLSKDVSSAIDKNKENSIFSKSINNLTANLGLGGSVQPDEPTTQDKVGKEIKLDVNKVHNVIKDQPDGDIELGEKTANTLKQGTKTWDGYGKLNNNIPTETPVPLSREEMSREKFKYLRKLEELEKKGANLTKKYNMDSPLDEIQGEYEMIIDEKEKQNSIKFQGKMLMAAVTGLEFLNNKFDPFDLKMDGWGEQVNENVNDYDEIFAELHDKYKSKAKMAPELKLLFQLGGSAIMVHMTNTMFKSAMPGMDDIMKQNPELMQQFTNAAVNQMGQNNPGFSNFMSNFAPSQKEVKPTNIGPPPEPINANKSERFAPPSNRPDLTASRGGNSIGEKFSPVNGPGPIKTPAQRREMKGPSDISQLLSGLKTKDVNIPTGKKEEKNPSTISVEDLTDTLNQKVPKTMRRTGTTPKNTVSLDL